MNRIAAVAAAVLLALTLTGCGAAATDPASAQKVATSDEPLVAQTPATTEPSTKAVDEAGYLKEVRDLLPEPTIIPDASDAQLVAAGLRACELKAAGEDLQTVSLIEGEEQGEGRLYVDSWAIIRAALDTLC